MEEYEEYYVECEEYDEDDADVEVRAFVSIISLNMKDLKEMLKKVMKEKGQRNIKEDELEDKVCRLIKEIAIDVRDGVVSPYSERSFSILGEWSEIDIFNTRIYEATGIFDTFEVPCSDPDVIMTKILQTVKKHIDKGNACAYVEIGWEAYDEYGYPAGGEFFKYILCDEQGKERLMRLKEECGF